MVGIAGSVPMFPGEPALKALINPFCLVHQIERSEKTGTRQY
jgi:hypothetical protein